MAAETYTTISGDTWDMIAKRVYGSEKHLDFLMAHNFNLLDYFVFPAGVEVNTPALPENAGADLPSWRKGRA